MSEVRSPLLAQLLRRLLEDPAGELTVDRLEAGATEDQDRLIIAVTASLELSGNEYRHLRTAVGTLNIGGDPAPS